MTTTTTSAKADLNLPKLNNKVVAAAGGCEAFSANAVSIAKAIASTEAHTLGAVNSFVERTGGAVVAPSNMTANKPLISPQKCPTTTL